MSEFQEKDTFFHSFVNWDTATFANADRSGYSMTLEF